MVIELSAETYDWESIRMRGHRLINILETARNEVEWGSSDDIERTLTKIVEDEWDMELANTPFRLSISFQGSDEDKRPIEIEVKLPPAKGRTYDRFSLEADLEEQCLIATFKVAPETHDLRILHAGDLNDADFDHLRAHIEYLFEALRRVYTDHTNTLLSEREREVVVLRGMGYDDETILDLMDISRSNLTQYENRIESHRSEAEATLALLNN